MAAPSVPVSGGVAEGHCAFFTASSGMATFQSDDKNSGGRQFTCYARIARDGIARSTGVKLEVALNRGKQCRFGWKWKASEDPERPQPIITE
eukprot:gene21784-18724_t